MKQIVHNTHKLLPFFASGEIIKGFGRGSKELGIPTANFSMDVVQSLPNDLQTGVYYGWANVDNGEVYKMVMSIGWNPFYDNKYKSMETHILHKFNKDLHGSLLKVCILGFLRSEKNFSSLEDLISAINEDITNADMTLDLTENLKFKEDKYFHDTGEYNNNNSKPDDEHNSTAQETN